MIKKLMLSPVAFLLVACATPYATPKIIGDSPRAIGIAEMLANTKVKDVDVFLVHGMCTHGTDWVVKSNNSLLEILGSDRRIDEKDLANNREVFDGETELYSLAFPINGKALWTHAIVWSPATIPLKKTLCYDRHDDRNTAEAKFCQGEPEYPYQRADLNDALKSGLLDDCLADAMVYVGPTRERIRDQMAQAIERAAGTRSADKSALSIKRRAETEEAPLFAVTESLGSKVFFDTLLKMSKTADRAAAQQTFARMAQIFMGANQIPILSLAAPGEDTRILIAPGAPPTNEVADPLNELILRFGTAQKFRLRALGLSAAEREPIQVVAFSDPNDLLSYPLHGSKQQAGARYRTVDVIVSNKPTYFGFLENPSTAHTSYPENRTIQKIIVCGIPTAVACSTR